MIQSFPKQNFTVEAGAYYRRGFGTMSEIAEVLNLEQDKMGIPHVRFNRHLVRGAYSENSEERTLSLESFCARYKERVRFETDIPR